jgi:addiction module HigA family antidote
MVIKLLLNLINYKSQMRRDINTNIHPGIILREDILQPAELSVSEAANLIQVSRVTLSKILNGSGSITPNIALRIEAVVGGNADFWLRMQRGYDLLEEKTVLNSILQI